MIKLGGLWKGQTKDGSPMLSGKVLGARVIVLVNKDRQSDKHPEYLLFVAEDQRPAPMPAPVPSKLPEEDLPF